ncbi:MAG: hypothetical protein QOH86_973, partial [Sphingomonadales bacterium]|nr:hypothetical protein [Sphingomonadales bacterium]
EKLAQASIDLHIIAAVRSEVLDGFGSLGQEVERVVHDRGVTLAWHFARRSLDHPLFKMLARKIRVSESIRDASDESVILRYFPRHVKGEPIENYLLDRSFYKPRDLIWRLSIVQKQFPEEQMFSERVLVDTENEFSAVMWDEVKYELSANYSKVEIDVIETLLSGFKTEFVLEEITTRIEQLTKNSLHARKFNEKHGLSDVLTDLYRLGAVGNFFREGIRSDQYRNRWAFRGDPTLLLHKRMTVNPSLMKRLSMVAPRPSRRAQQRKSRRDAALPST